jgi:hypothetical protein
VAEYCFNNDTISEMHESRRRTGATRDFDVTIPTQVIEYSQCSPGGLANQIAIFKYNTG